MRTSFPCPRYTELSDQAYSSEAIQKYEADNKVTWQWQMSVMASQTPPIELSFQ